jgi:hypothetical protein
MALSMWVKKGKELDEQAALASFVDLHEHKYGPDPVVVRSFVQAPTTIEF